MKDDSGSYAVFTEQGSSASQMTAAKVMDITSRLPGSAGQAADAVSARTQVKMEDAPSFLKLPKQSLGLGTWKVTRKNAWQYLADRQIKMLSKKEELETVGQSSKVFGPSWWT